MLAHVHNPTTLEAELEGLLKFKTSMGYNKSFYQERTKGGRKGEREKGMKGRREGRRKERVVNVWYSS